jgi:hypothetical protein
MRLNGVATSDNLVGDFIGSLSKSKMFNDVNLLFTEEMNRPTTTTPSCASSRSS